MKNIGLIIASHGKLAEGIVDSIDMIVGGIENLETVSVLPNLSLIEIEQLFSSKLDKLSNLDHILICVDLLSGTPCNIASKFLITKENISLLTGYNLPILLDIVTQIHNGEQDINHILNTVQLNFPKSLSVFKERREINAN